MTIDNDNLLESIIKNIDQFGYLKASDVPDIDLYMDQVTTLMEDRLAKVSRKGEDEKILTKTMINNYVKNNLLPPPNKKKYSKEHILMLIFIYYYKGILSIGDIQKLLTPINENFFAKDDMKVEDIYEEVFSMERQQLEEIKKEVIGSYEMAQSVFEDAPEEHQEYLKKFAFICALSYDVYVKRLLVEKMIDELPDKDNHKK